LEHVSLSNPAAVGQALATIGSVSQEAIVESAGGSWPASTVDVVRSFWKLLEHAGVTKFHRAERLTGDAFRSEGSYENGRLWQCSSLERVARHRCGS